MWLPVAHCTHLACSASPLRAAPPCLPACPPLLAPPLPAAELLTCPEVICRAWDSCMNTQPNTFTWWVHACIHSMLACMHAPAAPAARTSRCLHPGPAGSPAHPLTLFNAACRNVMGMMNNCVYRVKIHPRQTTGALEGG